MCGLVSFHVFPGRSFFLQSGYCLLQFTALLLYVSYKCEHLENILRYNCWAVQKISGMIWNRFFFPWKHTPGTGKLRKSVMASRAFHLQSTTSHLAGSVTASIPSHFFAAHCFFCEISCCWCHFPEITVAVSLRTSVVLEWMWILRKAISLPSS